MEQMLGLSHNRVEVSGGSGGASGLDEPIGSEYISRSNPKTDRITVGAGGLHDPSSKRKIQYLIVLSLLIALPHFCGIEQDDDSSEEE